MINCLAIDDEPLALAQLTNYIEKVPFFQLAKACSNAMEALEWLRTESVDLIYVDINMPDINGLEFVKSLHNKPLVIFTTAYAEYAIDGFRVEAFDYLLKPIGFSDFLRSANRAAQQLALAEAKISPATEQGKLAEDQEGYLFVKADYKMLRIDINKILYVESQSEYIRIYLDNDKPIMTLLSMKALEERLPADRFMRVHRSYLVNRTKITAVANNRIIIGKETYIPIGNQYKERFNLFVEQHFLGKP